MDDFTKGKGKGLAKGKSVQDLRNHQFDTFSRNDALNFSVSGVECRLLYGHTLVGLPEGALGLRNATSA